MPLPPSPKLHRAPLLGPVAMVILLGVLAALFIYAGVIPWALDWAVRAALFLMGSR